MDVDTYYTYVYIHLWVPARFTIPRVEGALDFCSYLLSDSEIGRHCCVWWSTISTNLAVLFWTSFWHAEDSLGALNCSLSTTSPVLDAAHYSVFAAAK